MTSMMPPTPLLRVDDLAIHGDGVTIAPVSLSLAPGERLTLLGETGSGKSLIAQAIMGTLPRGLAVRGRLAIDGEAFEAADGRSRRPLWGRTLALLPQLARPGPDHAGGAPGRREPPPCGRSRQA